LSESHALIDYLKF
jgi:hypothetical protein